MEQIEADSTAAYQRVFPTEYYQRFLTQGLRPDGRTPTQGRRISVQTGIIGTADASARVSIGDTIAIAAVKLKVTRPTEGGPADCGTLSGAVEVPSICGYHGSNKEAAGLLTSTLAALLAQDVALDCRQLCIQAGTAIWHAHVDCCIISANGSLPDAVALSALAALRTLRLPAVEVQVRKQAASGKPRLGRSGANEGAEGGELVVTRAQGPGSSVPARIVQLSEQVALAASLSVVQREDGSAVAVVDPCAQEELQQVGSVVMVVNRQGGMLNSMVANGLSGMSLQHLLQLCSARTQELFAALDGNC